MIYSIYVGDTSFPSCHSSHSITHGLLCGLWRYTRLVPGFMEHWLKKTSVDLGLWYYAYMASMAIFCPNSINILAGVNGLEVGQCIVLAILALLNDLLYFSMGPPATRDSHRFSAVLIIPFLGVSLALWKWNRWPATVFVGDTYCYFAGMVFAVVGILGHFSKTMLLLFIPQIINFIYSCPQIIQAWCPVQDTGYPNSMKKMG